MKNIRKSVPLIKRQEKVKVIILSRMNLLEEYKRELYDLKDISINDSDNIEIICHDKVIEISIKEINNVKQELTYIVFYEDLRVTLFDFFTNKKINTI